MQPDWITFDCFGTLVNWNAGFAAILRPVAGERTAELLRAYHEFERVIEEERPHRIYREVLVEGLLRAAGKIGMGLTEAQARRLPESWGSLPVFPDTEGMLEELRGRGCRLGVLTNCDEDLFDVTHGGFRKRFDLVVTAERVRDYKPSLSHFRYFSRTTGVAHGKWVHVACSWFHDIAPARELGIRRVWLDRDLTGEDAGAASVRVQTAAEVGGVIEGLYGSSRLANDQGPMTKLQGNPNYPMTNSRPKRPRFSKFRIRAGLVT